MLNSNAFHCNLDSYQPAVERTVQINNRTYSFTTEGRDNVAVAQSFTRLATVCDSGSPSRSDAVLNSITREAINLLSKAMPKNVDILEELSPNKLLVLLNFLKR